MKLPFLKMLRNSFVIICCVIIHGASFASPNIEGIQIYQKTLHLSEEHKQKLANDIDRYHNAGNLWEALREEFVLPHYEEHAQVQQYIHWYLNNQDELLNTTSRAAPYLYFILQQARKRHLPAEVVLLPIIESSYNPFVYSSMGAAGIWQMMPGTASGYGIKHNWWYDGRRDIVASTRAALDYLAYLGSFFNGNWLLAIAAYDTGEGNVLAAIKKNIAEGKSTDFWSLPLAQETKSYVPRLLAVAYLISHASEYPISFPSVPNAPYLAQIDIGGQISLSHAASLAGISLKELKQLNPGYSQTITDPKGPYKIILPIETVEQFTENLARSPYDQDINWIHYTVQSGDTLATIARHFNTTSSKLRNANPTLMSKMKPGSQLLIPREAPLDEENSNETKFIAKNTKSALSSSEQALALTHQIIQNFESGYTLKPGDTLYMVRKNDTIHSVAEHFKITPEELLSVNHLAKNKRLMPDSELIIPTHANEDVPPKSLLPGDTIYVVRKGDTVEKIADKFHTTPALIRVSNLLGENYVREGDRLVIPAHVG